MHHLADELAESLHKRCPRKLVSTRCYLSLGEAKANTGGMISAATVSSRSPMYGGAYNEAFLGISLGGSLPGSWRHQNLRDLAVVC